MAKKRGGVFEGVDTLMHTMSKVGGGMGDFKKWGGVDTPLQTMVYMNELIFLWIIWYNKNVSAVFNLTNLSLCYCCFAFFSDLR